MSGLISTGFRSDPNLVEAVVTNVDASRYTCSVKTSRGQFFNDVTWLVPAGGSSKGGLNSTPRIGERVLINTGASYPIIIGSIPRIGASKTFSSSVCGSVSPNDFGGPTGLSGGLQSNLGKPSDFVSGDQLFTNDNSGMVGLLREGTAILRASKIAQIIASKFDDSIRVIARNYDRISDFSDQYIVNFYNRLYSYYGFNRDFTKSKLGIHEYVEVEGDTALAESVRGESFGRPNSGVPAATGIIRKKTLTGAGGTGSVLMVETLEEDGRTVLVVKNAGNTSSSTEEHSSGKIEDKLSSGGVIARITILPSSIEVSYNDVARAVFDANQALVSYNNQATGVFNATQAQVGFGGTSTATMTAASAELRSGGHFINVSAAGVAIG